MTGDISILPAPPRAGFPRIDVLIAYVAEVPVASAAQVAGHPGTWVVVRVGQPGHTITSDAREALVAIAREAGGGR